MRCVLHGQEATPRVAQQRERCDLQVPRPRLQSNRTLRPPLTAKAMAYLALSSGVRIVPSPPWNRTNCQDVRPRPCFGTGDAICAQPGRITRGKRNALVFVWGWPRFAHAHTAPKRASRHSLPTRRHNIPSRFVGGVVKVSRFLAACASATRNDSSVAFSHGAPDSLNDSRSSSTNRTKSSRV